MTRPTSSENPHAMDLHVGQRVRARRNEIGLSQSALAEALGMSFQQVQKYERGRNRISASVLWEMSQAMEVPVAYFYDGFGADQDGQRQDALNSPSRLFATKDGVELAQAYLRLPDGPTRKVIVNLARQLAAIESKS